MSTTKTMILIGIGGAGVEVVRHVRQSFGGSLRHLLVDTDANTATADEPFTLLGGGRLAGHGAGGDIVAARMAAEESISQLDPQLEGVRLAVIATCLGGGTGGGCTLETIKHLASRGVPTLVFATTPFTFEGEDRQRNARGMMSMIEEAANATLFLPLDKLVSESGNMGDSLRLALDTLNAGITLFWRLVETPGYIRLDVERIRRLLRQAGRGRFATVTVNGQDRAREAVDRLSRAPLLAAGSGPVRAILCGVLGGDDLRLSELTALSEGLQASFGGERCAFDLATVNDEKTFSGRLAVVTILFEVNGKADGAVEGAKTAFGRKHRRPLQSNNATASRGRFSNADPTIWGGEDLDVPTFVRRGINLDF